MIIDSVRWKSTAFALGYTISFSAIYLCVILVRIRSSHLALMARSIRGFDDLLYVIYWILKSFKHSFNVLTFAQILLHQRRHIGQTVCEKGESFFSQMVIHVGFPKGSNDYAWGSL